MKKVIASIVTVIAVFALCLTLAACSTGIAGTYKFESMSMDQGGLKIELKVGESYMGVSLSEDAIVMTVKDDNTFEIKMNMGDETTETGTWEEKDGKYYLTADGETIEVALDGNTLKFEMEGMKLVLKK